MITPIRPFTNKYEQLFLGYCFSCNKFGHKAINCRFYARDDHMRNKSVYDAPKDNYVNRENINSQGDRNYNPFSPLLDFNIECYKLNNCSNTTHDSASLIKFDLMKNEK